MSVTVAGLALAALSACGGSGGSAATSSDGGQSTSAAAAQGRPITVTARDFSFDTPTISAKAGETITVTLQNQGAKEHSFTTTSGPSAETEAPGGSSNSVTFTLPPSGSVTFHCKYHPKMTGAIVLGGAGGAAPATTAPTATPGGYGY